MKEKFMKTETKTKNGNGHSEEHFDLIKRLDRESSLRESILTQTKTLEDNYIVLKSNYQNLCREFDSKQKALDFIVIEIQSQNSNLHYLKDKIIRDKELELKSIEDMKLKLDESNKIYINLIQECKDKINQLNQSSQDLAIQKVFILKENENYKNQVLKSNGEMSRLLYEVSNRETKISEDKKLLEEERSSIQPSLDKISQIKNENINLLKKIESDREMFEARISAFDNEKSRYMAEMDSEKERIRNIELSLVNKQNQLNEMANEFSDRDLELKAREAEVQRLIKRYQLNKVIENNQKE